MDLGPLTRLKDSLEIATNNTSNMLWKLQEFDTRLIALDKKMAPIQNVSSYSYSSLFVVMIFLEHIQIVDGKKQYWADFNWDPKDEWIFSISEWEWRRHY
jgi:hypothetical protein